jgi:hypothetical protein
MEAIAELFVEEKPGVLTDEERVPLNIAKLRKEKELQHGKNTGSGAGVSTPAEPTPSMLAHATMHSPSLQSATLDPIRAGRAGKHGDAVAPGKKGGSSLDTSSLFSSDSDQEGARGVITVQTEGGKRGLAEIQ